MKRKLSGLFDKTFWLYVLLGLVNYAVCNTVMLLLHNGLQVSKSASLLIEFSLQTAVSFLLNRYVTFRGIPISKNWPVRFVISVGLSYLAAKVLLLRVFERLITLPFFEGLADRLQVVLAPSAAAADFRRNLVMLACTMVYCVVNYIGQRYYVFRPVKQPAPQTN